MVIDPGDENYLVDSRVFVVPDFSFGVYYSKQNYFVGMSVPNLLGYKFDFDKNKYTLSLILVNTIICSMEVIILLFLQKLNFYLSTLISLSPGEKILMDLNAYFNLYDRFWAGASYRNKRSVAVLFQFAVNNQLRIAYTYDFDTGSWDITVMVRMKLCSDMNFIIKLM